MRIGIYGGSFDPIHNAHVKLALFVKDKLDLDKLVIIPAGIPPHKINGAAVNGEQRLVMCKLAFNGFENISVSDIELGNNKSYTYQTLKKLKKKYKNDELFFIMGADMYITLDKWKSPEKIYDAATIVTVPRNSTNIDALKNYSKKLAENGCKTIILDNFTMIESSTKIRENIVNGISVENMVPKEVNDYIISNKLYKEVGYTMICEYRNIIKPRMGEKRYIHSLNVEKAAVHLAEKYGGDVEKARIAGILHDVTKETSIEEQELIIKNSGYMLSPLQETTPKLWHSISGAMYVRDVLNIKDEDIVNAILYHTTARANMSLLEKILFVADFIGEERDYDGVDKMRKKAEESLEKAMLEGISFTMTDLIDREMTIDINTVEAYNELILNKK